MTILFTDIEGSTQITESLGDHEWMSLLREHNAIVREQVARHSGFEVKSQGGRIHAGIPVGARSIAVCDRYPARAGPASLRSHLASGADRSAHGRARSRGRRLLR
ncbi:MAG: adenylate/guanylate cyclase domain-containing protein [Actinomycetota bacterium]